MLPKCQPSLPRRRRHRSSPSVVDLLEATEATGLTVDARVLRRAVSASIRFGRRRGRQPRGFGCRGGRLAGQGADKPAPRSSSICHSSGKPISIAAHDFNSRWWPYRSPRDEPVSIPSGLEGSSGRSGFGRRGAAGRATSIDSPERCPSGRRSTPGKCVWVHSPSRVRIPPSPPDYILTYCFN